MLTTLVLLLLVCFASLLYILVIPRFATAKLFMRFLPRDIRDAARNHPDPSLWKQLVGWLLTAVIAGVYLGAICFLGVDGLRNGYGFWLLFGRYLLFMYGYKLFDILVQDQYVVITTQYFVQFYTETRECASWHDRSFNTRNQLIRIAVIPFICALLAGLMLWIGG